MASLMHALPTKFKDGIKKPLQRWFGSVEMTRPYEIVVDPDHLPLAGRVAVVTGASGAIGRAIAVKLSAEGARVVAVARNEHKLRSLATEITRLGGEVQYELIDLSDAPAIYALAERLNPIDILVNNAGGSSRSMNANIWNQDVEVIDELLTVNLRATILATAAFGSHMISTGRGGRVVNMGSTVAIGGLPRFSEYAAAKAGVAGFTRSAAIEFGPYGVTVNCVVPGVIQRGVISRETQVQTLKKGVVPEIGRAEDIAEMVAFVVGPRAGWITGQQFVVDGGRSLGLHGGL